MNLINRGKGLALAFLLTVLTAFNLHATDVFFNVASVFGTVPPNDTNRVFKIQSLSPFAGNFFWKTSDVSGNFYVSNALPTTYQGTMLAPPNSLTFSFYVSATNLGTINAQTITSIPANGVNTFPAGQTAYSAQASDLRYAFSTNSGGVAPLSGAQTTNLVISATNGMTSIVYSNAALFAGTNLVQVTSNALQSQIGSAGISAVTATNIATNQVFLGTNAIGIASGLSAFVPTNRFDISGAATTSTNGMAPSSGISAFVNTNRFLPTNNPIAGGQLMVTNATDNAYITANDGNITLSRKLYAPTNNLPMKLQIDGNSVYYRFDYGPGFNNFNFTDAGDDGLILSQVDEGNSTNAEFAIEDGGPVIAINGLIASNGITVYNGATFNGSMAGNASGLTNLPVAGISTNGSTVNQVITSVGGKAVWTNGAVALGAITNAFGTNFPNGNLANNILYYPTNDLSVTSNGLQTQISAKANTNSPTLFTPSLQGGNMNGVTNVGFVYWNDGSKMGKNGIFFELDPASPSYSLLVNGTVSINSNLVAQGTVRFNASSLTNISVSGISTNGSSVNQVITSVGGQAIWTNGAVALGALTNAIGTNFPNGNLANQTLYYPTNDPTIASNWFQASKLNISNATALNLAITNNPTLEGTVWFGPVGADPVIYTGTNVIVILGAGSAVATNGVFNWSTTLSCYTNWSSGAIYTNNGSAWLLQTNGITLYSVSGSNPVGASTAISGAAPAPTMVAGPWFDGNRFAIYGPLSVTNITGMSNSIVTNVAALATNSFINNAGGFGTNTRIYSGIFNWNANEENVASSSGALLNFASYAGGQKSSAIGSGYGAAVLSGATNKVTGEGSGVVVGGFNNTLTGGGGNASAIVGGSYNSMGGSPGIGTFDANFLGGGISNSIGTTMLNFLGGGQKNVANGSWGVVMGGLANTNGNGSYDSIIGGASNYLSGSYSVAAGHNAVSTKDNTFIYSDGTPTVAGTNSQFTVAVTNGIDLHGPLWLGALSTNGGIYFHSNQFNLYAVTNAMQNFDHWIGVSNYSIVDLYLSNGVVFMNALP